MSSHKDSGGKALPPPDESQNHSDCFTLSSIDNAVFLEGLQKNDGNRLHSTAVEEDLQVLEKEQGRTQKTTGYQSGAAVKRKQPETHKKLVGKKPAKSRRAAQMSAVRPVKNEVVRNREWSSDAQSQKPRIVPSSEEDLDEDASWTPSQQKTKVHHLCRSRKSQTYSKAVEGQSVSRCTRTGRGDQGGSHFELVLDAFLGFCDQFRESVASEAVKRSIESFSNNVKEQLLEKISSYKELRVLKRENSKVDSLIRKKTQRLLDAKNELMRAERHVWLLQKEEAELQLRSADLQRGHAFLCDLGEINTRYLQHREQQPRAKETYGASSSAALQLETKLLQARATMNK